MANSICWTSHKLNTEGYLTESTRCNVKDKTVTINGEVATDQGDHFVLANGDQIDKASITKLDIPYSDSDGNGENDNQVNVSEDGQSLSITLNDETKEQFQAISAQKEAARQKLNESNELTDVERFELLLRTENLADLEAFVDNLEQKKSEAGLPYDPSYRFALLELGSVSNAFKALKKTLEINPNSEEADRLIMVFCETLVYANPNRDNFALGNQTISGINLLEALSSDEARQTFMNYLGLNLAELGYTERAETFFKKAADYVDDELQKNNYDHLGKKLAEKGHAELPFRLFSLAAETIDTPEGHTNYWLDKGKFLSSQRYLDASYKAFGKAREAANLNNNNVSVAYATLLASEVREGDPLTHEQVTQVLGQVPVNEYRSNPRAVDLLLLGARLSLASNGSEGTREVTQFYLNRLGDLLSDDQSHGESDFQKFNAGYLTAYVNYFLDQGNYELAAYVDYFLDQGNYEEALKNYQIFREALQTGALADTESNHATQREMEGKLIGLAQEIGERLYSENTAATKTPDAGVPDTRGDAATKTPDAGVPDARGDDAFTHDAGVPDAQDNTAITPDAGVPDAEVDAAITHDAGVLDAQGDTAITPDAGVLDAQGDTAITPDAGVPNAEVDAAITPDAEVPDAEVIDAQVDASSKTGVTSDELE